MHDNQATQTPVAPISRPGVTPTFAEQFGEDQVNVIQKDLDGFVRVSERIPVSPGVPVVRADGSHEEVVISASQKLPDVLKGQEESKLAKVDSNRLNSDLASTDAKTVSSADDVQQPHNPQSKPFPSWNPVPIVNPVIPKVVNPVPIVNPVTK